MSKVVVHGVRLGLCGSNRNALLGRIVKQVVTTLESVEEGRVTPRSDDLNVRVNGVVCKLETDLVVALASAAVGNELAALSLDSLHHTTGDDGTSQASSQEVLVFVNGIALDGLPAQLPMLPLV